MLTAVYLVFISHENKVQLMKRHDIVFNEAKKTRLTKIMEFLGESKNLFDLLAEEDPGFRMGEMLQSAGIMPMMPPAMDPLPRPTNEEEELNNAIL